MKHLKCKNITKKKTNNEKPKKTTNFQMHKTELAERVDARGLLTPHTDVFNFLVAATRLKSLQRRGLTGCVRSD